MEWMLTIKNVPLLIHKTHSSVHEHNYVHKMHQHPLACFLTHCLLLFSLLTGSFILLKLLFLKSTMTSSLRWIVVRSLHSFFSTYLLLLILSIIPSFLLVFKIGSVLMVCLLIGFHLISHFALRLSQSMIPSLHSLLFPVVYYPKVPYLAHSFSLSIELLLAR